jgi:hypothetical protein
VLDLPEEIEVKKPRRKKRPPRDTLSDLVSRFLVAARRGEPLVVADAWARRTAVVLLEELGIVARIGPSRQGHRVLTRIRVVP